VVVMHISLTPELETKIKSKVESGMYNNASEVIREALRFMDSHVIFYRGTQPKIEIVRILHKRQDPQLHF
jgi:Arc/MetJ-type ribon-helix-helix transcriptional regulator